MKHHVDDSKNIHKLALACLGPSKRAFADDPEISHVYDFCRVHLELFRRVREVLGMKDWLEVEMEISTRLAKESLDFFDSPGKTRGARKALQRRKNVFVPSLHPTLHGAIINWFSIQDPPEYVSARFELELVSLPALRDKLDFAVSCLTPPFSE
jgi:hypothetical protein